MASVQGVPRERPASEETMHLVDPVSGQIFAEDDTQIGHAMADLSS